MGYGFLEKVYENSLAYELHKNGLTVLQQEEIDVYYEEVKVGKYYPDILVKDKVIIEIKACGQLCEEFEAQLTNYLRATEYEVGLLLNFGQKPDFRRKIFENKLKPSLDLKR